METEFFKREKNEKGKGEKKKKKLILSFGEDDLEKIDLKGLTSDVSSENSHF